MLRAILRGFASVASVHNGLKPPPETIRSGERCLCSFPLQNITPGCQRNPFIVYRLGGQKNGKPEPRNPPSLRSVTPDGLRSDRVAEGLVAAGRRLLLGLRAPARATTKEGEGPGSVARIWIRPVAFAAWWQKSKMFPGPGRATALRQ